LNHQKKKKKRKAFLYANDIQAYYYNEYQIQVNKKKKYIRDYNENPLQQQPLKRTTAFMITLPFLHNLFLLCNHSINM
jgi:hypothetical protein